MSMIFAIGKSEKIKLKYRFSLTISLGLMHSIFLRVSKQRPGVLKMSALENLTHINYANINGSELKYIDTLKYYQKSLVQLADTLCDKEREAVKKVSEQFFKQDEKKKILILLQLVKV